MDFGRRLKEERERLGYTQEALATVCNVSKRAQLKYESGEQCPGGGYLAGASLAGIDIVYVLTGRRTGQHDPDETRLLAKYRSASSEVKKVVMAALAAAPATPQAAYTITASDIAQVVQGNVDQSGATIQVGRKRKR
ncbi:helix-turn-helix domain-containing protein [Pseudoxanthomonas wuyuanensis]|uniref:Helix-turn-helix domain-containing protein n=1 Tax=Pseudoxanthomonas wuyuanensis TaxID=1073196 RepID=A0A286D4Q0_9GAMM|nr:helix-turn-helix transcriptional regulator [Pseudoxanthomonas wuyuanensis]KAF1719790.1 XRE family transcriptional regulator [Pseudoxanthomonas wuyuanensis]SOD53637.1 Helix-turn-helix domain-containing protein [Pseudoxanthomonas wuyuanensis]